MDIDLEVIVLKQTINDTQQLFINGLKDQQTIIKQNSEIIKHLCKEIEEIKKLLPPLTDYELEDG